MPALIKPNSEDRSTWLTYDDYLARDRGPVPDLLREHGEEPDPGIMELDPRCFYTREYFEREVERLWKRAWLWACRENDIPNVGDWVEFSIAGQSVLVVRDGAGSVRAMRNACRHRGLKLAEGRGNNSAFGCPFHGWTYNLDGSLKAIPCAWDFPGKDPAMLGLTPIKTGVWDGWVFVNLYPAAEPLQVHLGSVLPRHFARYRLGERWKRVHMGIVVHSNWKIVAEAFMETYHLSATHPTLRTTAADVQTRYDLFGWHSRLLEPVAAPCVLPGQPVAEAKIVDAMLQLGLRNGNTAVDDRPAREQIADAYRAAAAARGVDYSHYCDSELLDSMLYVVFPNFFPWGGTFGLTYRFRPNGLDPESSIYEVMLLDPVPKGELRPADSPLHMLKEGEKFADYDDTLKGLGFLLDQDVANCARIQEGLRSLEHIVFSHEQEKMIRRFHLNLDRFMR
jgi:phenylpropionate dioxygenase-like ring-hydroxylating dioxygenase large terminal subunit